VSSQVQTPVELEDPKLSICIATYKRDMYIGHTLEAILASLPAGVEVVIVDGASPDNTAEVVEAFVRRNGAVRYFRETTNSGVDRDFDKAVCYAKGEYCWLMSDDDILVPGAIARVLEILETSLDLLVVNSQVRSADLRVELNPRILKFTSDRDYDATEGDGFLGDAGGYLSFIGGVVIRRSRWLERERERYFGTLFIHAAVIFQAPLARIKILAEPLVIIRFGNAMWTSRGFEIWMFKWPNLIWSFNGFSNTAKKRVVAREPWRKLRKLVLYRALGGYSYADYRKFFIDERRGGLLQFLVAVFPAGAANGLAALYWFVVNRKAREGIHDLAGSRNANALTRWIARRLGIPTR
jgi:glycosyltransferase involved in cell wall biosynthesis